MPTPLLKGLGLLNPEVVNLGPLDYLFVVFYPNDRHLELTQLQIAVVVVVLTQFLLVYVTEIYALRVAHAALSKN